MRLSRRTLVASAATTLLARPALLRAQSSTPIRIGDINSYAAYPGLTEPYRKGLQLAVSRLNDLGGLDGRKVELVSRDDGGTPDGAVRAAGELLHDVKVDLLAGGLLSEVALAISAFALQNKCLYVAGQPLTDQLVWAKGNRFTYHVRASTYMQAAMLAQEAAALPPRSYATIASDDVDGRSAVAWFRQLLPGRQGDVRFVGEHWVAAGRTDAGSAGALVQGTPDALFCALSARDLGAVVRQGNASGLFANRTVVAMLLGDPEYLDILGNDTPPGWLVTGYPWGVSDAPDNKQFVLDYMLQYREPPCTASVLGVATVSAIASGILKSGGTDAEKMADGFADATFTTPFGICRFRAIDHQSTMGACVGRLAKENGRGGMVGWHYVDGASVMPPDAMVWTLRPA